MSLMSAAQEKFLLEHIKCKIKEKKPTTINKKTTKFHLNWFAPMEWNRKVFSLWKYRHICDSLRSFSLSSSLHHCLANDRYLYFVEVITWTTTIWHIVGLVPIFQFIFALSFCSWERGKLCLPPFFGLYVSFRWGCWFVYDDPHTNFVTSSVKQKSFFLAIPQQNWKRNSKRNRDIKENERQTNQELAELFCFRFFFYLFSLIWLVIIFIEFLFQ